MRLLLLLALSIGLNSAFAQSYCDPTSRCYNAADPANVTNSDSLLFVAIEGHQFVPGNDCPDVTDHVNDTLYVTPDGNLLTTQNATYTDAVVTGWIDWNKNFIFTADEMVRLPGHISTGQQGLITPPDGIVDGTYRMRLKVWNSIESALNDTNACHGGNLVYQNVDFSLTVVDEIPTADPPASTGYCFAASDANCESATTNGTTQTFIDRVSIQADNTPVNNITACDVYGDFTSMIADWTVGNTYLVSISSGTAINAANNNLALVGAIYIDWNKDTVFGPEETFPLGPVNGDSLFVNVIPPVDGATGLYRMRVRLTGLANTPEPCGRQAIGEVEDYTVLLRSLTGGEPACVSTTFPADGSRDNCTSSTITWNAADGATNYTVRLTPKNGATQYNVQTTDTFFTPDQGLFADTTYKMLILPDADGTFAFGCDTVEFTTAPVLDPVVQITPGEDTIFTCKGSNIPFSGVLNYAGNINHLWSGPAASFLDATNIGNPSYNNSAEDTLVLYYNATNDFSCGGRDSAVVVTLDGAKLDDFYVVDSELCENDSLFVVIKGAVGTVLVEDSLDGASWTNANVVAINDTLNYLAGISSGNHFIRLSVMLGDCDVMINPIPVVFNDSPTKPIIDFFDGNNGTACQGEGIGMRVLNHEATMAWNDQNSSPNDTLYTDGSANFVVINTVNGCVAVSDTLKPRVFQNPTVVIARDPENGPCIGDLLTLSVSGYTSQKWSVATADSLNSSVTIRNDGDYSVNVVDQNGCKGAASTSVTFFPKPDAPSITQLDPSPACAGSIIRLLASYTTAGEWSNGFTGDTLKVSEPGNYIYTSVSAEGCTTDAADSLNISFFNSSSSVKLKVTPEAPYCLGDSVYLISEFENNNNWNTGSTNDTIIVKESGSYFVESSDQNGCLRRSEDVVLDFGQIPAQPSIIQNGNDLSSDIDGFVYEWTRNGAPLNINKKTITVSRVGSYRLKVFNNFGCGSVESEPVQINTVGIKGNPSLDFSVYPNPSQNRVFNIGSAKEELLSIRVAAVDGKVVLEQNINTGSKNVSFEVPNAGNYILEISSKAGISRMQIIAL